MDGTMAALVLALVLVAALGAALFWGVGLKTRLARVETEKEGLLQRLAEVAGQQEERQRRQQTEFELLAQKILEAKSENFAKTNQEKLDLLLKPLDQRIQDFRKRVDEVYAEESRERQSLKAQVEQLMTANAKMSQEANNLARALKGDNKQQGNWGELVLERLLEESGLRRGVEYEVQASRPGEEGGRFQPDVIVKLPDNKHLVVDAKVSLKDYDGYMASQDEEERQRFLKAHVNSVRGHVETLSQKHYAKLRGVNSPDIVFLFMAVEPAYMAAMQADPRLSALAWEKNVAIVTHTTLFTTLRVVAQTWRMESQNRNAQEIAREGGQLYDKFAGFLESFEEVRGHLEKGMASHQKAMGRLRDGKGSVFRRVERLRELGSAASKRIELDGVLMEDSGEGEEG